MARSRSVTSAMAHCVLVPDLSLPESLCTGAISKSANTPQIKSTALDALIWVKTFVTILLHRQDLPGPVRCPLKLAVRQRAFRPFNVEAFGR